MAEVEMINDNFDAGADGTDPLSDQQSGEPAEDIQIAPEPEVQEQQEPVDEAPIEPEVQEPQIIEGTPFKDQPALVEGYKNIQRLAATKDREIGELRNQVNVALATIKRYFGEQGQSGQQTASKQPTQEEILQNFTKDPGGTIQNLVDAQVQQVLQKQLTPQLTELQSRQQASDQQFLVQRFLAEHPDFTEEQEAKMVEIMAANPYLKENPQGLNIAYKAMRADELEAQASKTSTTNAVAGAKQVAGLGGKKSATPTQKKVVTDEFDDVLSLDKEQSELFRMGKKH